MSPACEPEFIEGIPFNGYLSHAIRNDPLGLHRTAPFIVVTYDRALCGVGSGGMRVRLDENGEPRPWKGIDGCDRCHIKRHKITKEQQ